MTPEQQAAWAVLQTAFTFVTGELRQRWQLAREVKNTPATETPKPAVSEAIQTEIQTKLSQIEDEFALKMMSGNIKSSKKVAENSHRLWNKLREQLPLAAPDARARLELQMEDAARTRDEAIAEIKTALQTVLEQEIVIQSPKS